MILVYTKFDQSSPSAQTKSLHKVYTQSLLKVYTPSIIVYTKFDYPPYPSGTPTSALRVGPYGRLEVRRRAGCTPTAHGTVRGPLVGAPGAFGTTRFCRPTLLGHLLRPSTAGHLDVQMASHSAPTCNTSDTVSWPSWNFDRVLGSGDGRLGTWYSTHQV